MAASEIEHYMQAASRLREENKRLRQLVRDCGLDPDRPIPPPKLHTLEQRIQQLQVELNAALDVIEVARGVWQRLSIRPHSYAVLGAALERWEKRGESQTSPSDA